MLPRAVSGKRWYAEKFGEEKVAKKWAVIPGVCAEAISTTSRHLTNTTTGSSYGIRQAILAV
ncbi:unnamed protein product [Clonostachys rosea]|uniref:Uncharacterized protein n=1 Tax=Bionectria ochroleuca TaxID=29856 RepID=A0ABY6UG92_BIOOC|nr:unnamed protein product [Clonostachys rosea]